MTLNLKEGDSALDFTLPVSEGEIVSLKALKGKNVVLYFYPKDNTPGCTLQAKEFRDHMKEFQQLNTEIIGVSKDSLASHDKFSTEHCLPFRIASDQAGEVCEQYGVWQQKSFMGKKYMGIKRSTFLIDKLGVVRKIWPDVSVKGHIEEILNEIKKL